MGIRCFIKNYRYSRVLIVKSNVAVRCAVCGVPNEMR